MARCNARLVIEAENAALVEKALLADNPSYVRTSLEPGRVLVLVEAENIGSLLATLDDLLVNLKVADELLGGHAVVEGRED